MIKTERINKVEIITFNIVKIDALISDNLNYEIERILEIPYPRIILDLKGVQYVDSTGFSFFLSAYKTARNKFGILKFARPESTVAQAFRTLNLDTVFEIHGNLEECIKSFPA